MRHAAQSRYNVAWFKLAEFVARGEKERALGLYKLLCHSFEDYALGCQLAGDILLAFNDKEGIEKYKQAAELYKQNNRFLEAIALYEQLYFLVPQEVAFLYELLELYTITHLSKQATECVQRLLMFLIVHSQHAQALDIVSRYKKNLLGDTVEKLVSTLSTLHSQDCIECQQIITALHML